MLWTVTGLCAVMLLAVTFVVPETRPPPVHVPAGALRRVLRSRGYRSHTAVFAFSFAMMMAYISALAMAQVREVAGSRDGEDFTGGH